MYTETELVRHPLGSPLQIQQREAQAPGVWPRVSWRHQSMQQAQGHGAKCLWPCHQRQYPQGQRATDPSTPSSHGTAGATRPGQKSPPPLQVQPRTITGMHRSAKRDVVLSEKRQRRRETGRGKKSRDWPVAESSSKLLSLEGVSGWEKLQTFRQCLDLGSLPGCCSRMSADFARDSRAPHREALHGPCLPAAASMALFTSSRRPHRLASSDQRTKLDSVAAPASTARAWSLRRASASC